MRKILVLAAVLALSACGSPAEKKPAEKKPEVATLTSTGPNASPKVERPRERLDGTPEEFEALLGPYNKCLKAHGALPKAEWYANGKVPDRKTIEKFAGKNEEADRICGPLYYPLPPWEQDPANPEAKDFALDVIKCLKSKGIKGATIGDNGVDIELGGSPSNPGPVRAALDVMPGCERQAAADLKKSHTG